MRTALCLAGDGARMPIKAGMLKAYDELGLKHDMLFGTSSGALAGALYHQGDLKVLLDLCLTIKKKDVYRLAAPWKPWGKAAAFFDTTPLRNLLEKLVKPSKLAGNQIPYRFNVTEFETNTAWAVHSHYTLFQMFVPYLLASATLPVLFPLVEVNGASLCDGGLLNDYCIHQAVELGAERVIVMTSLTPEHREIDNWVEALGQTFSAIVEPQLAREVKWARDKGVDVIVIKPDKPTGVGTLDFDYKDKQGLIDLGYQLAKSQLLKSVFENPGKW